MLPWLYQPQYKPLLVNFIPKTQKCMTTTSQLKLDRHKNVVELNQLMGSQWNPSSWCQDLKQRNTETDVNKLWDFLQLKRKAWIVSWYIYKNNYGWQSWHAVHFWMNEWLLFKAKMSNISATCTVYIMAKTSYILMRWWW